jgi:hypothetical protein
MKKIIYSGIAICVFLCSCRRPEQYSDIPEIKFISFEKINQTEGILAFYFQDGEGDIGLNDQETKPPFDFNFFCDYYEKQNGIFVKIDSIDTPIGRQAFNFNGRIPRLSYLPQESIHGEIYHTISPAYYDISSPYNDTIQLQFYIVDRKLNKSNIEVANLIRSD